MTDESVDVYYSCIVCQAFSRATCVVAPDVWSVPFHGWMQKATNELDPPGPCQVITKAHRWKNRGSTRMLTKVKLNTPWGLEGVSLYSIMEKPMTSCGCSSAVYLWYRAVLQRCCITNREYAGMTPLGMTFPELASWPVVEFRHLDSWDTENTSSSKKKFAIKAEAVSERIVWMPKELKRICLTDRLNQTAKELYERDNFTDMIGDGRLRWIRKLW